MWGCPGTGAAVGGGSLVADEEDGDEAVDHTSVALLFVDCLRF